ncbi:MAG: SIS domain-containing protein [Planctomycetota bacterium]
MHSAAPQIFRETAAVLAGVRPAETRRLLALLTGRRTIFIAGAGRTGLVARCFATRLAQAGLSAYVMGETITPPVTRRDILIACSRSGETLSVRETARRARQLGGTVIVLTAGRKNPLARLADYVVVLPPAPTRLPGGTQFETALFVYFDTVVLALMKRLRISGRKLMKRHANLE